MSLVLPGILPAARSTATRQDRWEIADAATVRWPPSEFPELPAAVRRQLDLRGCTIPQGGWPRRAGEMGVVTGEFLAAGQSSWAVLCSVERVSAILVFDSSHQVVAELHRATDRDFLPGAD